jgi:hypothetical protein
VTAGNAILVDSLKRLIASAVHAMAVRPWRTPRLPDLVGAAEACEILGVQKMTLHRWMKPGSGTKDWSHGKDRTYMIEPKRISSGPVWVREDVERFAEEIGRQRAPAGQGTSSRS